MTAKVQQFKNPSGVTHHSAVTPAERTVWGGSPVRKMPPGMTGGWGIPMVGIVTQPSISERKLLGG